MCSVKQLFLSQITLQKFHLKCLLFLYTSIYPNNYFITNKDYNSLQEEFNYQSNKIKHFPKVSDFVFIHLLSHFLPHPLKHIYLHYHQKHTWTEFLFQFSNNSKLSLTSAKPPKPLSFWCSEVELFHRFLHILSIQQLRYIEEKS